GRRETVDNTVAYFNRIVEAVARNDGDDWAEDLFLSDVHLRIDAGENCRLVEETSRELAIGHAMAAGHQLRPFVAAYLDISLHHLQLAFIDARPHLDGGLQRV